MRILCLLITVPLLYNCGSTDDGSTSSDLSEVPSLGFGFGTDFGIDPDDPTSFGSLPTNLRFSSESWSYESSSGPITSGASHGLSPWIGKNLLCNHRNNVAQIDAGKPELVRYELDGLISRRNAIGFTDPSCDESAISNPDLCFLENTNLVDITWGVFTLQGLDGSTTQAIFDGYKIFDGYEVDTDLMIDGINYRDGFIQYGGNLVAIDDDGENVCVLLENATVGL